MPSYLVLVLVLVLCQQCARVLYVTSPPCVRLGLLAQYAPGTWYIKGARSSNHEADHMRKATKSTTYA